MKDLKWGELGFNYIKADKRYVSMWRDGHWDDGALVDDEYIRLHESACVLHYCQEGFEGLKAYRTASGDVVTFRPDMNAERMLDTCRIMMMPEFPKERFIDAVDQVVRANADFVPPHGTGASLYIRPYMFGSGVVIGVKPAPEYMFRIFATPVGPYFKGGAKSIHVMISDFDRAAPHGTGHIKAGLNYAMSLHPNEIAHGKGFADNIFLDPATRTKIEEASGANIIFVTKDGSIVTPKSDSILPSITRRSIIEVGEKILGIKCEQREVTLKEVPDFVECALCGTAAVLSPVGSIDDHGHVIKFRDSAEEMGPVSRKLRETLVGIQSGDIEGPAGWVHKIC